MKKLMLIVLLVALVLPLTFVSAQRDKTALVMVQRAAGGSLTDNGDGTFSLVLEGVSSKLPFVRRSERGAGALDTPAFFGLWSSSEDLAAPGVLTIGDTSVSVTLTMPAYDPVAETASYTIEVVSVRGADAAPDSFEEATLFIRPDDAFVRMVRSLSASTGLRCTYDCDDAP